MTADDRMAEHAVVLAATLATLGCHCEWERLVFGAHDLDCPLVRAALGEAVAHEPDID